MFDGCKPLNMKEAENRVSPGKGFFNNPLKGGRQASIRL